MCIRKSGGPRVFTKRTVANTSQPESLEAVYY